MSTSILEALEYLKNLLRAGQDAEDSLVRAANLFSVDEKTLREAYDNQP